MTPVRSLRRALGWPALLGLALLVVSAALALQPPPPPPAPAAAAEAPAPVSPAAARVAMLLERAVGQGVRVVRTEQRDRGGADPGLQLLTPARGDYAALRGFVEASLAADPHLALESVRLHRAGAQAPQLEAELVWWLAVEAPR